MNDVLSTASDAARELYTSDGWRYRRAVLYAVIAIFAAVVGYGVVHNTGSPTEQTAVWTAMGAIMTLTCSYVFGAIWDDHNKRRCMPPPPGAGKPSDDGASPDPQN